MTSEFFEGFLDDYFAECEEHLSAVRAALLEFESAARHPSTQRRILDDLFRYFHSLKGISAMVELRPAEHLAHELENYLRAIRDGQVTATADSVSLLIEGTQQLEQVINAHRARHAMPATDAIVARIAGVLPGKSADAAPQQAPRPAERRRWKCSFAPTRELLGQGMGVDAVRRRLAEVGTIAQASPSVMPDGSIVFNFLLDVAPGTDLAEALRELPVVVEPVVEPPALDPILPVVPGMSSGTDTESAATPAPSQVVRVDLGRLDELMRHVGDLVISRARLLDSLEKIEPHVPAGQWRAVQENAVAIDRQVRTLREGLMRVRLVPVGEIFRRMPFVVRDLARETGKRVSLLLHGQATEIDKYLIERMMDPVLHLVRNAVSHGIEPPDQRIASGKSPEGTITLNASAAGELVTIEIADDGRGVDAADVSARARRAGLDVPDGNLDGAALLALLCAPGFSTKDDTDRASGRGVGMAVVKETVERLSGTLSVETESGVGTRFTIQLPLTLAIADALIARVGSETFAVPQSVVREAIEVRLADLRQIEGNEIVAYRHGSLPIVRLGRLFGVDGELAARFHALVIGSGAGAIGVAVDRILGQKEIVVRTIADPLVRVEGISGATDLGDGRVVLILDPVALARIVRQRTARKLGTMAAWGRVRA